MKRLLPYLLPVLLLNLAAGFSFWYHQRLEQLDEQLTYSVAVLTQENAEAARQVAGTLKGMEAAVEKNRNQPADVARFHRAEALDAQVRQALSAGYALDDLVRRAAGAATNPTGMRQPAQPVFGDAQQPVARQWEALHRQIAACADSLRRISPVAARPVQLPEAASGTTAVQALADLAATAQQLLTSEAAVLRQLSRRIGARVFLVEPVALATAESNVVAPGDTYRAHLLLAGHFPADLRMDMRCNGRPVPVDAQGIGWVRFQVPLRPGPGVWTGSIRINQNGRDTTFAVRVPYRVARR